MDGDAVNVKVVARKRNTALIEWVEGGPESPRYRRSIVPATELREGPGGYTHSDPDIGIPYGAPWEDLLEDLPDRTAGIVANELRRLGIWTLADLQADLDSARAAFQKAYSMDVQRLRSAARTRYSGGYKR